MTDLDHEHRVREATRIFLRLQEMPEDRELQRARDAFLASGDDACAIYADVEAAWSLTAPPAHRKKLYLFAWLTIISTSIYFAYAPLRVQILADLQSATTVLATTLESGDTMVLDAASAISDDTSGVIRSVQLLEGAAYFDVTSREEPFVVQIAGLSVRVTGTAFETAFVDDTISVAVAEGQVWVSADGHERLLEAGDRLIWRPSAQAVIQQIQPDDIAVWRQDRLVIDGMTFAQVADVIDRRIPGRIVVLDQTLARSRVFGGLNLTDPEVALRTITRAEGAQLYSVLPLGIAITR